MNRILYPSRTMFFVLVVLLIFILHRLLFADQFTLSQARLEDKIRGGWLAKSMGVVIGAPTEFAYLKEFISGPLEESRKIEWAQHSFTWEPDLNEIYWQDDNYVQVTFIEVMKSRLDGPQGIFSAKMQDYAGAFKNSQYPLWHANLAAREQLKAGTPAPFSGMWGGAEDHFNEHSDDIDWQIECDWIGFMCPGMPGFAQALSDSVGHVMNYGDGLYGGHFVTSMIASAFRHSLTPGEAGAAEAVRSVVVESMEAMPRSSRYYRIIADVVGYYDEHHGDPAADVYNCWNYVTNERGWFDSTQNCPESRTSPNLNIAASLNGAYIAIGLLYGGGDLLKTLEYAIRCGQDSDCNPGNAGSVLGVMLGYDNIPQYYRTSISSQPTKTYAYTSYTHEQLVQSCVGGARRAILQNGGELRDSVYTIEAQTVKPPEMLEVYGFYPRKNPDATSIRQAALPGRLTGAAGAVRSKVGRRGASVEIAILPAMAYTVDFFTLDGKKLRTVSGIGPDRLAVPAPLSDGLLIARVQTAGVCEVHSLFTFRRR